MSTTDLFEWVGILLVGAFGLGCVLVGVIGGVVTRDRERKRIAAFMPSDSGTVTKLDLEEMRRHVDLRFNVGGDDDAA
jgi:hypothetical protein